jgi:hypothetical protein
MNRIWVAEATESSTYTVSHEISKKSHLKEAAICAEKWASSSHAVRFFTLLVHYTLERSHFTATISDGPVMTRYCLAI